MEVKLTRQIKARSTPKAQESPWVVVDEAHSFFDPTKVNRDAFASMVQAQRRPEARLMIATQAMIKSNSGKRERFIGDTRWSDGTPLKAVPKKFVPPHAIRKQAGSAPEAM